MTETTRRADGPSRRARTGFRRRRAGTAALLVGVMAAACGNPVSPVTHVVPARLTIHDGSTQLISATRTSVDGILTVTGVQTPVLTVRFEDSDGAAVTPGTDFHMTVLSANSSIAIWQPVQPGGFTGRIIGTSAGTTTLTFQWMHGAVGSGHPDLEIAVPVTVSDVTN